jgi:VWFA-related protein
MRTTAAIALVLVWCIASGLAGGRLQETQVKSGPQLQIEAVVLDDDGNPVKDMRPNEFEVWIGGFRVPIESLTWVTPSTRERPGRLIVLLLDDITLDPTLVGRAREVAQHVVDQLQPGDRMGVVMLNGGPMELTADAARLRSQIDRFRQALGVTPVDRLGEQLLAKIASIGQSLIEAPEGRRILVAIGSSWLLDTPIPPSGISGGLNLKEEWFAATRALALTHMPYYVIDPRGVGFSRQVGSAGLAREAGGHAFINTNDLDGAADRILREADNYYVIRVADPPVGRKAVMRELEVKTKRDGVTLRARRGIPGGGR